MRIIKGVDKESLSDQPLSEENTGLSESDERVSAILRVALDAIIGINQHNTITAFNPAAEHMFGYTRDEAIGASLPELVIPPRLREGHNHGLANYMSSGDGPIIGKIREVQAMRKDGSEFPVEIAITAIEVAPGTEFIAHLRDISQRKWAEAELAASAAKNERIAEVLQRSMLHAAPKLTFTGITVETLYEAALDEAEVGGDFFDAFALNAETVALVVGDVSGKGLVAAGRTVEVRYALRAFLHEDHAPNTALARVNNYICNSQSFVADNESFVILALVVINTTTGEATFSAAGAEPTPILRHDGTTNLIEIACMPIGMLPGSAYLAKTTVLQTGDTLLIATDGITEARHGSAFWGVDGMAALVEQAGPDKSLPELSQIIFAGALDFADGELHDDVCLLLARRQ